MGSIKVLVVDDSVVVRRVVTDVLAECPDIEVVGTAAQGRIALAKISALCPDIVTLGIEMPVMDGLETLEHLRVEHPRLPVVMFSTLTERGAAATLTALECGASDYVTKPANVGSTEESRAAVRTELVPKILALAGRRVRRAEASTRPPRFLPASGPAVLRRRPDGPRAEIVVIGSSTGGPDALTTMLPGLPADLPVPVLVTQHMPAVFTRQFAARLDGKCAVTVSEAVAGEALEPGHVYIAPGDWHLRLGGRTGHTTVALDQGSHENFCRPAVDVLFRSAAQRYGERVLAVVLTGMGSDGAQGCQEIALAGGDVIAQDRETSVVWGMPGAAAATGTATQILPLGDIAAAILARVGHRSGALTVGGAS